MDGSFKWEGEFPCFRCGVCCTSYQVLVDLEESRKMAAHLTLDWESFKREYTDPRWPGKDSLLLAQRDGACVFLRREPGSPLTSCVIHHFRPRDCRTWLPGLDKTECREGLRRYGLTLNCRGELEGPPEGLQKFLRLVKPTPPVPDPKQEYDTWGGHG